MSNDSSQALQVDTMEFQMHAETFGPCSDHILVWHVGRWRVSLGTGRAN